MPKLVISSNHSKKLGLIVNVQSCQILKELLPAFLAKSYKNIEEHDNFKILVDVNSKFPN